MYDHIKNNTLPECDTLPDSALKEITEIYRSALAPEGPFTQKAQPFSLGEPAASLTQSRLAGQAPWFKNTPVPLGANGVPLIFIAQIKISDVEDVIDTPADWEHFALQFYIEDNDLFGCDFPSRSNNADPESEQPSNFRVILVDTRKLNAYAPPSQNESEFSIFNWKNHKTANKSLIKEDTFNSRPSLEDASVDSLQGQISNIIEKHTDLQHYQIDSMNELEEEYYEGIEEEEDNSEHPEPVCYVGGHPDFTQSDPRHKENGTDEHTVNLLSLGYSEDVTIGDAGCMHFLVRKDSLMAGDLSDVIYNWDCH